MKLSGIITRQVEVIQPDDSLQSAAKKMRDRDIGFFAGLRWGDAAGCTQ